MIKKARFSVLDKNEKKTYALAKVYALLAFAICAVILACLFALIDKLAGAHDTLIMHIIAATLKIISMFIAVFLGAFIGWPIITKASEREEALKKIYEAKRYEISFEASIHLHEYYGLQEPYTVTKCYDSTDKRFKNKDVCIFECDGEIRLKKELCRTVNLTERDFGCYAFTADEITLCYRDYLGAKATVLNVGNETFLLGGRAKRAIEKLSAYSSKSIFIPCPQKRKGTSAYYEFQFCKKALPTETLLKEDVLHFSEDSLLVHMDDEERLFRHYTRYLSHPHSPDGSGRFYYAGINYYTKEETETVLEKIEKERPPYAEPLIEWLREAAEKYNGFFFLGI